MDTLSVTLDAVIVAVTDTTPRILLVSRGSESPVLPSGPLDPQTDTTLELGLRRWVTSQTGVDITYVEQLYTFGDLDRSATSHDRNLSIAYVALTGEATTSEASMWVDVYDLFPWEDHRQGRPSVIDDVIAPSLEKWAGVDESRIARTQITFGIGTPWDPIRSLERYELLYQIGLVAESARAADTGNHLGTSLGHDHRRIAATALGRLRGKLTYRPVIFEVMPERFTLTDLQSSVEALVGIKLHKQNFRRIVERADLVEATGEVSTATGGRPAELYQFRSEVVSERPRPGFPLPRPKQL